MKSPFCLIASIRVYLTLLSLLLKDVCERALILDFNRLCETEVYKMLKNQLSAMMQLYGDQVGRVMPQTCEILQNPHVADTTAGGLGAAVRHQFIFYGI